MRQQVALMSPPAGNPPDNGHLPAEVAAAATVGAGGPKAGQHAAKRAWQACTSMVVRICFKAAWGVHLSAL